MAGGSHVTLRITLWQAQAMQSHLTPSLESSPTRSGRGPRGAGKLIWEPGDTWVSAKLLLTSHKANSASPDSLGTGRGNGGVEGPWGCGDVGSLPSFPVYGRPPRCWWRLRRHGRFLAIYWLASPQVGRAQKILSRCGTGSFLFGSFHELFPSPR